jgi:hypothetical protein
MSWNICVTTNKNSAAFTPQANSTDWVTATGRRILVSTFADRGVSSGLRGGTPTAVNLNFLDRRNYFFFQVALICAHEAEWTPWEIHCYSVNLVALEIQPGARLSAVDY